MGFVLGGPQALWVAFGLFVDSPRGHVSWLLIDVWSFSRVRKSNEQELLFEVEIFSLCLQLFPPLFRETL